VSMEQRVERGRAPHTRHDEERDGARHHRREHDAVEIVVVIRRDDEGPARRQIFESVDAEAEMPVEQPANGLTEESVERRGRRRRGDASEVLLERRRARHVLGLIARSESPRRPARARPPGGYGTESGCAELLELLDPMLGTLVGCAQLLELLDPMLGTDMGCAELYFPMLGTDAGCAELYFPMLGTDAGCAELYFPMLGTEIGGGGQVLCAYASETMTVTSATNAVARRVFFIMSSHPFRLHR
jgi:hypothetical protein